MTYGDKLLELSSLTGMATASDHFISIETGSGEVVYVERNININSGIAIINTNGTIASVNLRGSIEVNNVSGRIEVPQLKK